MEPQKPRDPRRARLDPRLQAHSPTPAPSSPKPASLLPPADTSVVLRSSTTSSSIESTDIPTSELAVPYKARPLFCVVCASNQVRQSFPDLESRLNALKCFRIAPWSDTLSWRKWVLDYKHLAHDCNPVLAVFALFRLEQDQQFDCLAHLWISQTFIRLEHRTTPFTKS
jgi:hypothetical protein